MTPHVIVMVTTSYPRFPGDSVGTFMEPIAKSVAARGHTVHLVAPWHPLVQRSGTEDGVSFHFYRYAPLPSLNVFGYAAAMRADVSIRGAALAVAPLALAQGWRAARRVARRHGATMMHGHWVVPGGVTAAMAAPRLPLVVSLHGSDVYLAETFPPARLAARVALRRAGAVTACSRNLAERAMALGADGSRLSVVPYGVDVERFRPNPSSGSHLRASLGLAEGVPLIFAAGRLVRKKGFEYLIDAMRLVTTDRPLVLAIGGEGDLEGELRERAEGLNPSASTVRFLGRLDHDSVADYLAAADVVVVPSVRDDAGNVDGVPNVVMETLATGTPLVTTRAGGIGAVVTHEQTALIVPERDPAALAEAIDRLLREPGLRARIATASRDLAAGQFTWARTAEGLESAYERALAFNTRSD